MNLEELIAEISKLVTWQATAFRQDCEKIAAWLEAGTVNPEMAQLMLETAYDLHRGRDALVKRLLPMAKAAGCTQVQRIKDNMTLQRPVIRDKFEVYMKKFCH